MELIVYPGSFDPVTLGHIDIIKRASKIADKIIIAVLNNSNKKPLFSIEERIDMIKNSIYDIKNAKIDVFDGLLVDFMKKNSANIIVRGLRAVSDYEYEIQLAQTNRELNDNIDTIFFTTNIKYSYLSSSVVKEIAMHGGSLDKFVNPYVKNKLIEKYNSLKGLKML